MYSIPSTMYFCEKKKPNLTPLKKRTNSQIRCDHLFLFQWPINQKLYVIGRLFVSFALIGWFIADIVYESETFYQDRTWTYAVYATNWSFFLLVITSVYQTVCSIVYTVKSSDNLGGYQFTDKSTSLLKERFILHRPNPTFLWLLPPLVRMSQYKSGGYGVRGILD